MEKNKLSEIPKSEYKFYEKILRNVIKAAKNEFEISRAKRSCKDTKKIWTYIDEKMEKKAKKCNIENN